MCLNKLCCKIIIGFLATLTKLCCHIFFGVISVTEVEFGSQVMMFSKIFIILTRVIMSLTSVPDNHLLWVCAKFRKFLNTSCLSCKSNSMLIRGNICYRFSHKYNR